jgi:hypothetical protein
VLERALDRLAPQVLERSPLHDPEQRLPALLAAALAVPRDAPREPRARPRRRGRDARAIAGIRRAVVERHRDVRAERALDVDDALGRETHLRAVDHRAQRHAVVVDLRQVPQAEHLVAARVGQDRPVACHQGVQPAELRDRLLARPQVEVVGVREHHPRAERRQIARQHAFHRPARPDRHERRRRHLAVRRREHARARRAIRRARPDLEPEHR